jgi:hypothetical protein
LLANGFHAALIFKALSSDTVTLVLPILCTAALQPSFVDDMKSGFIKEYLPRTNIRNVPHKQIVACAPLAAQCWQSALLLPIAMSALTFTRWKPR